MDIRVRAATRGFRWALAAVVAAAVSTAPAMAQEPAAPAAPAPAPAGPNTGALTFSAAFDVPALYYFRGIRQEVDPKLTMWPYADLKITLMSGDGAVKSAAVDFGIWESMQTGSSGTGGGLNKLHYEEDFFASFILGFDKGVSWQTTWTSYTSPNGGFGTVKEILFKVSQGSKVAPYGIVAFEVGDVGADGGSKKGTYVELGVGPSWSLGKSGATVAIPLKVGLSAKDYYESPVDGKDSKFGYFDAGVLFTVPFTGVPAKFGSWNFHAGADVLAFGTTLEQFNVSKDGTTSKYRVVPYAGIGFSY